MITTLSATVETKFKAEKRKPAPKKNRRKGAANDS
jgi:hypothetical protein